MMLWILDAMRRAAHARHEMLVRLLVPVEHQPAALAQHRELVDNLYLPMMQASRRK